MLTERPLWVTIPTIGQSELLLPLVRELQRDENIDKVILTVNLEEYVEPIRSFFSGAEAWVEVVETWEQGPSIYHGWNASIKRAREANAYLAVLNDDIRLFEPNAITYSALLLEERPRYAVVGLNWLQPPTVQPPSAQMQSVKGSYRHHGVGGFAWVCDPHKVETIPDDLVHWGGDDFIFFRAEDAGYRLGIANHIHVEHPAPETTAHYQSWTHDARIKDREVFDRYYPGRAW